MAESLVSGSPPPPIDLDTIRSRVNDLRAVREEAICGSSENEEKLIDEFADQFLGLMEKMKYDQSCLQAGTEDLELYIEHLKKEVSLVEEEKMKLDSDSAQIERDISENMTKLDCELEDMSRSHCFFCSKEVPQVDSHLLNDKEHNGDGSYNLLFPESYKMEISELSQLNGHAERNLCILQDFYDTFKRDEVMGQIEELLSESRPIKLEGNCIRLFLRTPIPRLDALFHEQQLNWLLESSLSEHELLVELDEWTLDPKNVEIFPNDISLSGLLDAMRASRAHTNEPYLKFLVRQIHHRVLIVTLRRTLIRDTNKTRHSFEYSDRDDIVTAHLIGGVDVFIKIPECWPIPLSSLKLVSIRSSDVNSQSIPLVFLCKVKDLANSLDHHTRLHLTTFVDAIEEILTRELRSEFHSADGLQH